ncbi:protein disulfide isomerase-like 5-4 [Impatiens glandulifera]|uniref:protein disulfide isomerase-like 5-4 n=1 Tax=Impatiens glandulifera TaxID=253017 RepID=UPI001FB1912D|nr:protein disulfide isomerase-like 5-4 [Impatiens glandulifera]
MVSTHKLKSVDFYRKIPRDLTEASLSGAGLSIIAALSMMFLFGMELNDYLTISTSTSVIVDRSPDGESLRIDFNISFPVLSCEFASVDVSDVLGTNRLNITKTVRKYPIDINLKPIGSEFYSGPISRDVKHDDDFDEEYTEGSVQINSHNFERISLRHPILVVNFFAPWCYWSKRLKPSWEKAAKIIRERYDPEVDGRIVVGKVDCTENIVFCKRNHIQGFPSIRIFRKGSDIRDDHGLHEHESYYGDRDTESLVKAMENLIEPIQLDSQKMALGEKPSNLSDVAKMPAPLAGGCRIEGFVRVKKVPGNLVIAARSGAHSFDASQMNMSHIISHLMFGKKVSAALMDDMRQWLPYLGGNHDRLSGRAYITHTDASNANITIEHYIQVVKTEVITRRYSLEHQLVEEYEYTAHSSLVHSLDVPVAKFHFDPSPMQISITETSKSFSHFITSVCAIIGGVFTVAGILDSLLHNTIRMMKKVDLGKNF